MWINSNVTRRETIPIHFQEFHIADHTFPVNVCLRVFGEIKFDLLIGFGSLEKCSGSSCILVNVKQENCDFGFSGPTMKLQKG